METAKNSQRDGDKMYTQEKKKILQTGIRISILCCTWYALSAGENIIGKIILNDFPHPLTLSTAHAVFLVAALGPVLRMWQVPPAPTISQRYYFSVIVPVAFGKVISSFSSQFSIYKVPVSYAHTVKASMPIFTVILSRIILGDRQPWKVYVSLVPIVGGIAIATLTEISFNLLGLVSALFSTFSFALQNIFSKKAMKDKGIHHLRLLFLLGRINFFFLVPAWLLLDVSRWMFDDGKVQNLTKLVLLLLVDCLCNFAHNMIAFTIVSLISPLSYSVANATKRIVVISISLLALRNPVSAVNVLGMSIAILGVLLYNKTKVDQIRDKRRFASVTPTSNVLQAMDRYTTVDLNHRSLVVPTAQKEDTFVVPRISSDSDQKLFNYTHRSGNVRNVYRPHNTANTHFSNSSIMSPTEDTSNFKYINI